MYREPEECITPESLLEEKRQSRLKTWGKYIGALALALRLLMELIQKVS